MKLLVATRNAGKFREIAALFRGVPIRLVPLSAIVPEPAAGEDRLETAPSFAANARAKARYFHDRTGLPTLAEDSGLRVDALDGAPGVRTKRYAPPAMQAARGVDAANNQHLLRQLRDVPEPDRTAHFHSAVAVVTEDDTRVFGGRVDGVIAAAPRGPGGFGYDPIFYLPDRGVTMAELSEDEKNALSHRGQAVRAARDWLEGIRTGETRGRRRQ